MDETKQDDGLGALFGLRPHLLGIVCRMLGRAAEAEDLVQDMWMQRRSTDRMAIQDLPAYLAAMTTLG